MIALSVFTRRYALPHAKPGVPATLEQPFTQERCFGFKHRPSHRAKAGGADERSAWERELNPTQPGTSAGRYQ